MKLFRRKVTHIRQPSESTMTLCGRKVLGPPKVGRPVCYKCVELMIKNVKTPYVSPYKWTRAEFVNRKEE